MARSNAPRTSGNADDELPKTSVKIRSSVAALSQPSLDQYMESEEAPPAAQDDATWAKRYADLRRHSQKKESEANKRLQSLEDQINQLQNLANRPMPRTQQEFEAWKNEYPDIANFIEIIADEKAGTRTKKLEDNIDELNKRLMTEEEARAKAQLQVLVPDIWEIVESADWQEWMADLPPSVQDQINNSTDPEEVAKMVRVFKATQQPSAPSRQRQEPQDKLGVLQAGVRNSSSTPTNRQQPYKFTAMQIKNMNAQEYEKNEPAIEQARVDGLILDDMAKKIRHTDYR